MNEELPEKLTTEQENYLGELVISWLMEAKFELGYLVGQTENPYFDNSKLMYYWYSDGGIKLAIEHNHKTQFDKNLSNLWAVQINGRYTFVFRYPRKVHMDGVLVVERLVKKYFPGIVCESTFAVCQVGEYEYCSSKRNQRNICQIIDGKYVCRECKDVLERKARKIYPGYVYLIGNKEKRIYKVGKSRQPKERYKAIATKLPFSVEIVHVIGGDDIEKAEKLLHNTFAPKRTHGEWFELSDEDVAKLTNLASFDGNTFLDASGNKVDLK